MAVYKLVTTNYIYTVSADFFSTTFSRQKVSNMTNTNEDFKRIIGESRLIYLNKMSRNSKIEFIREIASEIPNGKDLSIVQARLVDLMKQQR